MRLYVLIGFVVVAGIFGWLGYVNRDATPVYLTQLDPENPETTGTHIELPVFVLIVASVLVGVIIAAGFYAVPGFRERERATARLQSQLKKIKAQVRKQEQEIAERDGQIRALREKAGLPPDEDAEDLEIELTGKQEVEKEEKADEVSEKPVEKDSEGGEAEGKPAEEEVEASDDEEPV